MKSIAIIPARNGSKRLPGKNFLEINGKSLLNYAIDAAIQSQVFSEIIITTNDRNTLDITEDKYGPKILYHKRTEEMSADNYKLKDLIKYFIEFHKLRETQFDSAIALILPTSPLRTLEDIRTVAALMVKNYKNIDGIMSVTRFRCPPQHALRIDKENHIQSMYPEHMNIQSQNLEPAYIHDGSIIFVKPEAFMKYGDFYMPNMMPYYIDENRAIDINTSFDLKLAELLMGVDKK